MKTSLIVLASIAGLLATITVTREARALGPVDLEIAGKAGYSGQDLGFGFGGRAGVSFFGLYGGLNLVDYLGVSHAVALGCPSPCGSGSSNTHALEFGGEVGYGFKISFVTIRPQVGFGDMSFSGGGNFTSSFYVEPGGVVQLGFGHLILGVDANCLVLTSVQGFSTPQAAFTMHGQAGVRF